MFWQKTKYYYTIMSVVTNATNAFIKTTLDNSTMLIKQNFLVTVKKILVVFGSWLSFFFNRRHKF